MSSIYREVLGSEFDRLQPELQEYFGLAEEEGFYGVGTGTFDVAGCPSRFFRTAGAAAAAVRLPVPALLRSYERNVPFTIRNFPHTDPFGRRSLTAVRHMQFQGGAVELEDSTILNPAAPAGPLLDYVGPRRNALTDLELSVSPEGYLRGRSCRARLFVKLPLLPDPLRLVLPESLAADAYAVQWWDAGRRQFRIQNKIIQRQLGTLLVYEGRFDYELRPFAGTLPADARPQAWQERR